MYAMSQSGKNKKGPKAPNFQDSGFDGPTAPGSRRPLGASAQAPAKARPPPPAPARPASKLAAKNKKPTFQAKLQSSKFLDDDEERSQFDTVLGKAPTPAKPEDDDEAEDTNLERYQYDGLTPAPEVTAIETWRAVNAPIQSRPGRRSPELYELVLKQFAVAHNPRYRGEGPDRSRAHIFIWDVTRAMNAEVPHFQGARELTLAQTAEWVRHDALMLGWKRADQATALASAQNGSPVLALPRDLKLKFLALVCPVPPGPDGRPLVAGAARKPGVNLTIQEALGVFTADYFVHP